MKPETTTEEKPYQLSEYQGHSVTGATVSIRNTGDGLSKAMQVDPVELELGGTVYVVLECEVEKHRYEPADFAEDLTLVNMLKAGAATIVDRRVVGKFIDAQAKKISDASPEPQLELEGDEDE